MPPRSRDDGAKRAAKLNLGNEEKHERGQEDAGQAK